MKRLDQCTIQNLISIPRQLCLSRVSTAKELSGPLLIWLKASRRQCRFRLDHRRILPPPTIFPSGSICSYIQPTHIDIRWFSLGVSVLRYCWLPILCVGCRLFRLLDICWSLWQVADCRASIIVSLFLISVSTRYRSTFRVWRSSVNNNKMITIPRWTSLVNHSKKIDAWKQNSSKYDEDSKYYASAVHPNYQLVTRKNPSFVHAASVWNEGKKCANSLELFSPLLEALRNTSKVVCVSDRKVQLKVVLLYFCHENAYFFADKTTPQ